jgi:hypothetical protein
MRTMRSREDREQGGQEKRAPHRTENATLLAARHASCALSIYPWRCRAAGTYRSIARIPLTIHGKWGRRTRTRHYSKISVYFLRPT